MERASFSLDLFCEMRLLSSGGGETKELKIGETKGGSQQLNKQAHNTNLLLALTLLLTQKSSIPLLPLCAVVGQMVSSHFTDWSCRLLQLAGIEFVVSISSNEKAYLKASQFFGKIVPAK
jgi:hypothetical protein